jgi:FkbM family methyltransferase
MAPIKSLKSRVWFFIHNHRRNRVVARFARLCKNLHRASEHPGYDVETNGEQAVLARTVHTNSPVLFDVGANLGDWSAMAKRVCPTATIHAFELNPVTAVPLTKRFSEDHSICVHDFGLAKSSGRTNFYSYSGEASVLSGLRVPFHSHVPHEIKQATVRTGDSVCEEFGISKIDFLKIDAEGADFEVLLGFERMLAADQIAVIQFEHEAGRYLRDFYDLLIPMGYSIGKLYSNYVDFREHTAELENFLGPNYIALPSRQTEVISSLKAGWKAAKGQRL